MTAPKVNVRIEPIVRDGNSQTVAALIEGVAEQPYRLWYRIDGGHAIGDLAQTHAFAVSIINQAMAVGRDLFIDGPLTRGLIMNMDQYQRVWTTWEPHKFRHIALQSSSLVEDEPFRAQRGAILPFSGGIDSLFSASLLRSEGALAGLVMIHGLDLQLGNEQGWKGAFSTTTQIARSLGVPATAAATNWQEVAVRLPGYLGYLAPTIAVPILMSQQYGYLAMPSSYSYDRLAFPLETTPLTDPLLGRPGFPLLHHGAWMHRIDKVRAIASWPEAMQYMRPCDVNADSSDGTACGRCRKCICAALLFRGLGLPVPPALGGQEPTVQLIENFVMTPYALITLDEAVEAAKSRAATEPWVAVAERRINEFNREPAVAAKLGQLERELNYVLGGGPKTALGRYVRRITRAFRGRRNPHEVLQLPHWPHSESKQASTSQSESSAEFNKSSSDQKGTMR